ncbi:MAG TPA: riboflavin synthase [Candidatus Humimicrobiaceae bacterium]
MFTGIIKETGKIKKISNRNGNIEIEIQCQKILNGLNIGDSISISGVCLTVTDFNNETFRCDVSFNTLNSTSFKHLRTGDIVNLESSLTPSDKLGGHFVHGHVDCAVKILKISAMGDSHLINLELPRGIRDFVTLKGSIAIDGISLTISGVESDNFSAVIIPYTYKNTNLIYKNPGDLVNVEVDMLARYIVNFLRSEKSINADSPELKDKELKEKLKKYGFTNQE